MLDAVPSSCLPPGITLEAMAEARRVWEPIYGHALSDEDVIEILINVRRLLDVLRPFYPVSKQEKVHAQA